MSTESDPRYDVWRMAVAWEVAPWILDDRIERSWRNRIRYAVLRWLRARG